MKKCKYCQSNIDTNAKICPNCKKKQGIPKWIIVILIIIGIAVVGSAMSGEDETNDNNNNSNHTNTQEALTLLDDHSGSVDDEYSYKISGTIKNNKDEEYSYVQIEFYAYDKDGNLIDTCLDNNNGLEANGTWKFSATCFLTDGNAKDIASYKLKEITKW